LAWISFPKISARNDAITGLVIPSIYFEPDCGANAVRLAANGKLVRFAEGGTFEPKRRPRDPMSSS
jgi:hypothetical protein